MRTHHKWTQKEIGFLVSYVQKYGFVKGCNNVAKKIGVTYRSCSNMWQRVKYTSTCTEPLPSRVFEEETKKKTRRARVTEEEEIEIAKFLKKNIQENPNNLNKVFEDCAKKFGFKSKDPISRRWYGYNYKGGDFRNKPSNRDNLGIVYAVVGKNYTVNKKVADQPETKKTRWILSFFMKFIGKEKR